MARTPTREPERIIGRYALFDQIGAGGMATVHFGRLLGPAGFSKTVAIKRLHPHFARDPEFSAMFLDEARLAARVQHPNVVATLDVVARDGELFLVMEFVEGLSLSGVFWESVRNQRPIPMGIVGAIMVNVLSGLHAAHEATNEQGHKLTLIHRDVSPQNVLVGRDGVARVLDFGIAKAIGRSQTTREGRIKGKLAYMAPEQIRAQPLDRRADIYAAAVVLWELLTMQRLFDEEDDATTIWRAVHENPPLPGSLVPGLPIGVDELVMRGLAKNPADRFSTAREMAMAIERLLGAESTLSVGDFVATCGKDALEKMASKVREIESISEELNTSDIVPDEPARKPSRRRSSADEEAATLLREMPLPDLPALEVPDTPVKRSRLPIEQEPSHAALELDLPGSQPRRTEAYPFGQKGGGTFVTNKATLLGGILAPLGPASSNPTMSPLPAPTSAPAGSLSPLPGVSNPTPQSLSPLPAPTSTGPRTTPHGGLSPLPASNLRITPHGGVSPAPSSSSPPMGTPALQLGGPTSGDFSSEPRSMTPHRGLPTGPMPGGYAMELSDMPPPSGPTSRSPLTAPRYAPPQQPMRMPSPATAGVPVILWAVLAVALLGGGGYWLFGRSKPATTTASPRGAPPAGGVERACEASRQQIMNGADLGPVDTYGWVVELWLARDEGAPLTGDDPAIAHYRAANGSLDPAMGLTLSPQDHGEVTIDELPSPPPVTGKEPGVVIRLSGGYAGAFFANETRPTFLKLADSAFDESKASIGALYARCGHMAFHDVGAWFRGKDPQSAADAIGFQMSGYAGAPWVTRSVFSPIGKDGTSLEAYRRKRIPLDAAQLATEVHVLGGNEEESEQKGTTVTFPVASPVRAISLARWITKQSDLD